MYMLDISQTHTHTLIYKCKCAHMLWIISNHNDLLNFIDSNSKSLVFVAKQVSFSVVFDVSICKECEMIRNVNLENTLSSKNIRTRRAVRNFVALKTNNVQHYIRAWHADNHCFWCESRKQFQRLKLPKNIHPHTLTHRLSHGRCAKANNSWNSKIQTQFGGFLDVLIGFYLFFRSSIEYTVFDHLYSLRPWCSMRTTVFSKFLDN